MASGFMRSNHDAEFTHWATAWRCAWLAFHFQVTDVALLARKSPPRPWTNLRMHAQLLFVVVEF